MTNGRQAGGGSGQDARGAWACGPVFEWKGDADSGLPVVLAVPHAGRAYAETVIDRCRISVQDLSRLEDRYADLLIDEAVRRGFEAVVAHTPRAVIDLNRDRRDIDPRAIEGLPRHYPLIQTSKQRGGLGLFPRSLPRTGDIWRGAMPWEEAAARIEQVHVPYHAALESRLEHLARSHGEILLLDIHSMPPLTAMKKPMRPDIVIGDRYGASAMSRLAEVARAAAESHGLKVALNHPYPGYYALERHGRPDRGRHALQIEISRDLYLDDQLDRPGDGLAHMRYVLAEMAEKLAFELGRGGWSEAAE